MKPAPFRYFSPDTLEQALALLEEHAPEARALAGGQSLVPMMNFRLARPSVLIDLNRIDELTFIREDGSHLSIGAMARTRAIERSDLVKRHAPLLAKATKNIAHLPIRSRGTIGGSIANADPAAEYPATALALDCELVLRNSKRQRRVAAGDFFQGVMTTAIEPDELLIEIIVPKAADNVGCAFVELSRRSGDFALVGIAAEITNEGGKIISPRLAACGVGPHAVRLKAAEAAISGRELNETALADAGAAAAAEIEPESDLHADSAYRRRIAAVLTRRAISEAVEDARLKR